MLLCSTLHLSALANPLAAIVSVLGTGDKREDTQLPWTPAEANQKVPPGGFVRTGPLSQMSLLLPDRTQVRLNQNSQLQIKSLADSAQWSTSQLSLTEGRAWSQARPPTAPLGTTAPATRLRMDTPAATLSIRGTDWEVQVLPDGRTLLAVFSGEVALSNGLGEIKAGAGESALAEPGKAPVKLLLARPVDRVQWVSAWQAQPRRWLGDLVNAWTPVVQAMDAGRWAQAASLLDQAPPGSQRALLQADLAMAMGDSENALRLLEPIKAQADATQGSVALLARVYLALGQAGPASRLLQGSSAMEGHREIHLARAELALFQGEARSARLAISEALAQDPGDPQAWLLLGRLETERDNLRAARQALGRAQANPVTRLQALAQTGLLETQSGALAAARQAHAEGLAERPADYVALTGRGILSLRAGKTEQALDDFLRAGLIEPGYARAWLYQGVAFHALGEDARARQALLRASEIDPLDPLPHLMLGILATDGGETSQAIDASQQAQQRLPYLKSLNALLSNQKGNANLGSALAEAGLEDWAQHYAALAHSPWWAGSQLFSADRLPSGFLKNSSLLQGFLTDPTVFGADPRQSSLVAMPGHHARLDLFMERSAWRQNALVATANGLVTEPLPLAYFISHDGSAGGSRESADVASGTNQTFGLGLRPRPDLGLFAFGTRTAIHGQLRNDTLPDDPLTVNEDRVDLGVNVKIDASNQIWVSTGAGHQASSLSGTVNLPTTVPLNEYASRVRQSDLQLRQVFALEDGAWLSWGLEQAEQDKPALFDVQARPGIRLLIEETRQLQSRDAHLLLRLPLTQQWTMEAGLFSHWVRAEQSTRSRANGVDMAAPTASVNTHRATHPRGGLRWQTTEHSTLTLVSQRWRRPAGNGSLAPGDTLGVALNDQVTGPGGLYQRTQLRIAQDLSPNTFVQALLDDEQVNNLYSPASAAVPDLAFTELENLRQRRDFFSASLPLEGVPAFLEGRMKSLAIAINHRLDRRQTLSLQYRRTQAAQTGAQAGLAIPYLSDHTLHIAHQLSISPQWRLGLQAQWRSERFRDEANSPAERLAPGWTLGAGLHWNSTDRRWNAQALLDSLARSSTVAAAPEYRLVMRASRLF